MLGFDPCYIHIRIVSLFFHGLIKTKDLLFVFVLAEVYTVSFPFMSSFVHILHVFIDPLRPRYFRALIGDIEENKLVSSTFLVQRVSYLCNDLDTYSVFFASSLRYTLCMAIFSEIIYRQP